MKFIFDTTQRAVGSFDGLIEIEAESYEQAKEKIRALSQRELGILTKDAVISRESVFRDGPIEVYDEDWNQIN